MKLQSKWSRGKWAIRAAEPGAHRQPAEEREELQSTYRRTNPGLPDGRTDTESAEPEQPGRKDDEWMNSVRRRQNDHAAQQQQHLTSS
ncbi:hypothetical protein EYF80_044567 [Liparis tanakae]|uniref:Uncharacterized protein n=1 Tax=Liparis tanakae TaxID=230148 RepID=A0A4Z2FWU2_9TELE|nr:hypothetical protein EYF80_044567 [Liparis tanakae]